MLYEDDHRSPRLSIDSKSIGHVLSCTCEFYVNFLVVACKLALNIYFIHFFQLSSTAFISSLLVIVLSLETTFWSTRNVTLARRLDKGFSINLSRCSVVRHEHIFSIVTGW